MEAVLGERGYTLNLWKLHLKVIFGSVPTFIRISHRRDIVQNAVHIHHGAHADLMVEELR